MSNSQDRSHPSAHWHDEARSRRDLEQAPGVDSQIDSEPRHHGGWGHSLMMLACCVPLVLVVVGLVLSGAAGSGAVLYALLCTAMMAAMVFMMPGHRH